MSDGISILVYGRNDSHGYNLHRRAALSLNAMAHVLGDGDEIIFCDCNTPNDLPTFPEAIADTLTERARRLLRVIRVRPNDYRRLAPQCRLPVCEPFCRNVALRRTNPHNAWVLATNTDMIFRPLVGTSLTEVVAGLPHFLHLAPRFELPEICWETLNRNDPATAIRLVTQWGSTLRLDHLIRCPPPVLFDGPGDCQLLPRALAFDLDGFDESIVHGWHVDGNLCARAAIRCGENRPLDSRLYGYHCDHNRVATHTHSTSTANSGQLGQLIHNVTEPGLPRQREHWGARNEVFEEINLNNLAQWPALEKPTAPRRAPSSEELSSETHNQGLRPELALVLPHLVSHLATRSARLRIGYVGFNFELPRALQEWAAHNDRVIELSVAPELAPTETVTVTAPASIWDEFANLDVIVVDADPGPGTDPLRAGEHPKRLADQRGVRTRTMLSTIERLADRARQQADHGPRILALNAQNSWLEQSMSKYFSLTLSPYASRVRPAVVLHKQRGNAFSRLLRRP